MRALVHALFHGGAPRAHPSAGRPAPEGVADMPVVRELIVRTLASRAVTDSKRFLDVTDPDFDPYRGSLKALGRLACVCRGYRDDTRDPYIVNELLEGLAEPAWREWARGWRGKTAAREKRDDDDVTRPRTLNLPPTLPIQPRASTSATSTGSFARSTSPSTSSTRPTRNTSRRAERGRRHDGEGPVAAVYAASVGRVSPPPLDSLQEPDNTVLEAHRARRATSSSASTRGTRARVSPSTDA